MMPTMKNAGPSSPLDVLYEDNHLLIVNKPVMLATMGTDGVTAHRLACQYIADKYNKPGRVYLGVTHRLDAVASGVLCFARTSKAAARLSEQFRQPAGSLQKQYLAIVTGIDLELNGIWRDHVAKNEAKQRMEIVPESNQGALAAELRYEVLAIDRQQQTTGVAVQLITGRKHQIRLQFSSRKRPILGDLKYGGMKQSFVGIALHAWKLTLEHPTRREPMTFTAPPPRSLPWKSLRFAAP